MPLHTSSYCTVHIELPPYDILTMKSPSSRALRSPSKPPLSLSHFSCTLSLAASQFYLKDHLLDSDSSCDFQVSTFWPRVGVLTLPVSVRAGLPFSLNEFIFPVWEPHKLQPYINHFPVKCNPALLAPSNRSEEERGGKKCSEMNYYLDALQDSFVKQNS